MSDTTQKPHLSTHRCPKCQCISLMTNDESTWCVNGQCDFDTRKVLTESQAYGNDCPNGRCNL